MRKISQGVRRDALFSEMLIVRSNLAGCRAPRWVTWRAHLLSAAMAWPRQRNPRGELNMTLKSDHPY
jgi:hypothetical protein